MQSTITDTILMIRPKQFGYNAETAANNSFQSDDGATEYVRIKDDAIKEFDNMVAELRRYDIDVIVIEDTEDPVKHDAVFPNNWLTTHSNGHIVTFPMFAASRRSERREDIVDLLIEKFGFTKRYGFEYLESEEEYLEGTGSMIIDRENRVIYACLSPRTNVMTLEKFAVLENCRKVIFHSYDSNNELIYHTNVMMAMGEKIVVICLDTIKDPEERHLLVSNFEMTGKTIIEISISQMEQFAGNMMQVKSKLGEKYLLMSRAAYNSLSVRQIDQIKQFSKIISIPIPTIEKYGGGSVRCMVAEIFKPFS